MSNDDDLKLLEKLKEKKTEDVAERFDGKKLVYVLLGTQIT